MQTTEKMLKRILCLFVFSLLCKTSSSATTDVNSYYEAETGNVILNPSFEFSNGNGLPLFWYKRPYTDAKVITTRHYAKCREYCLCISDSDSDFYLQNIAAIPVDYTFPYAVEFWVKTEEATGENYLEVLAGRDGRLKSGAVQLPWDNLETFRTGNLTGTSDWKKISLDLKIPQYSMYLLIRFVSRNNTGKVFLDGLYLNGYGSSPMEVIINQAGFHPEGVKDGVVRTKEKYAGGSFELLDQKEKTVCRGNLSYLQKYVFGEHYYRLDFSDFKEEGSYKLKIRFDRAAPYVYPGSFRIDRSLYMSLWEWNLQHLQHARCGCEVPGWFKAAFLDDAAVYTERFEHLGGKKIGHQDVTGGWFDAGDVNKFNGNTGTVVWELLKSWELMFSSGQSRSNIRHPAVLEAEWGSKYLLKLYRGEGGFWGAVRSGRATILKKPLWESTDNMPDTPDDRIVFLTQYKRNDTENNKEILLALAQYISFCKKYELNASGLEPYVKTLEEAFPINLERYQKTPAFENPDPCLIPMGKLMQDVSGDRKYHRDAKRIAAQIEKEIRDALYERNLLASKNPDEYLYKLIFNPTLPFHFIYFLLEYAETYPSDDLTPAIKETVKTFMEKELVPLSAEEVSPVGHTWFLDPLNHKGRAIASSNRNNIYQIGVAIIFAKASRVLENREYLRIAERNLGWILGRNYVAGSSLVGMGHRQLAVYTDWLQLSPGHKDSYLPGGICKGIAVGQGFLDTDFKSIMANPLKGVCMPKGFPYMHSFPSKDCPVYQTEGLSEVWIRVTGAFLLACGEIEKSLKEMGNASVIHDTR